MATALRGVFEGCTLAAPADRAVNGTGAMIAVRPEYMELADKPAMDCNAVAVRIAARQYGGAGSVVQARTRGGTEIVLTLPSATIGGSGHGGVGALAHFERVCHTG